MALNKEKFKQFRIQMNNFCLQIPKTLEGELSNMK